MRRHRRLRTTPEIRRLLCETTLQPRHLIYPIFIEDQIQEPQPIQTMPGIMRETITSAVERAKAAQELGIGALLLFGIPSKKDETGSSSWQADGVVQQTIAAMKATGIQIPIITDVCLCAYTTHGHCGVLTQQGNIDNDATVELLSKVALSHAEAGCDMVAPSDMMDLRIANIRSALDAHGYKELPIIAYGAKFASALYGPFRDAAGSTPAFGDRRSYQINPANSREAVRDALEDCVEGADMLMVKPAVTSLDIIAELRRTTSTPLVAYQVSGEYTMLKAASQSGAFEERSAVLESLLSIHRAGADLIVSYFALEIAKDL